MNDIIGGTVLIGFGLFVSIYAYANYNLGTVIQMEPGMVPASLGVILTVLGVFIFVPACFRSGRLPAIRWKQFIFVLISLASFGLTVERLGLVPATLILVCISRLADTSFRPVSTILLGLGLAAMAVGVFVYGLGIPFRIVAWNF